VNELDLPANNSLLQSNGAPPNSVTEDNPPMSEIADAAKSDFANVTVRQEWGADAGSASWILQMLAALAGKVVALGRKYGVPTPAQEAVYAILKPYRTGLIR
jgi:hypothetical protein